MTKRKWGTGRIYLRDGCKKYTIQYRKGGKRIREATGTDKYHVAEQILKRRLAEIETKTFVGPQIEKIKVEELWPAFQTDQINKERKSKQPPMRWRKHLQPFFGWRRVVAVGSDALGEYIQLRKGQGAKNATINREISLLRRMFQLGYESDPKKVVSLPKFPHLEERNIRTGYLEPPQYANVVGNATDLWLRAALEVAYTYGWRSKEVKGLQVRNIDFNAGVIKLDPGTTKNDEGREVPMTPSVRSLLWACALGKEPEDLLLTRPGGGPIGDFRKRWRNLCAAGGVSGRHFHDLRRTAARDMRRAGVPESVIMKIGGWKTRSVFERYNIVDQRDMREGLARLEQSRAEFGPKLATNGSLDQTEPKQRVN